MSSDNFFKGRFVRYCALPTIKAAGFSLVYCGGLLVIWRRLGRTNDIVQDRVVPSQIDAVIALIDNAISPAILGSSLAIILSLSLWFFVCFRSPVEVGQVRKLRGYWWSCFVLGALLTAGISFFQAIRFGDLPTYMNQAAMTTQGLIGFGSMLLGYWVIGIIATNKQYRPATLPF